MGAYKSFGFTNETFERLSGSQKMLPRCGPKNVQKLKEMFRQLQTYIRVEPEMGNEELPPDVSRFLEHCIDSVEQLRVLLLLHSEPEREWSTAEIDVHLRSSERSIDKRIRDLYVRKVLLENLSLEGKHRFWPASDEIRTLIQKLAEENQQRPYKVIDAIFLRPTKVLEEFAAAFRIRGKK
jgi:hypothetical protein